MAVPHPHILDVNIFRWFHFWPLENKLLFFLGSCCPTHLRAMYFGMKSDLKAKVQLHAFTRNYQCFFLTGLSFFLLPFSVFYFVGRVWRRNCKTPCPFHCKLNSGLGCVTDAWPMLDLGVTLQWITETLVLQKHGASLTFPMKDTFLGMRIPSHHGWAWKDSKWRPFDWTHNVFLGTGRDLVASGIKTLVKQDQNTGPTTVDDILSHVDLQIRTTCKQHGFLQPRNQYLDEFFQCSPKAKSKMICVYEMFIFVFIFGFNM